MTKASLSGKVALVTGAGLGIGYGLCEAFAAAGGIVALNDIDPALADSAVARIKASWPRANIEALPFDVADVLSVCAAIDDVAGRHGRLDIVVANAGITQFGRFLDTTVADFDRVTDVNLRGSFFTAQAAARNMLALGTVDGRILLMASVTGLRAFKSLSAYGITKAGIMHMARVLALELGETGITVNAICPGAIVTERTLEDDPAYDKNWASVSPNGRVGQVSDIVQTALFLVAPDSRHITGQTLQVDGGWTLRSPVPDAHPD